MRTAIVVTVLAMASSVVAAGEPVRHASPYQGQEKRAVKSLADAEVADLLAGRGAGYAKAAELNGVPGPAHILEMKTEIGLSAEQEAEVESLHQRMQADAVDLGRRLVALEAELDAAFATSAATRERLARLLGAIASVESELRFAHLAAHLDTPAILTRDQIQAYNELRGYAQAADPCANPPAGHDAARWRQHNNCPN